MIHLFSDNMMNAICDAIVFSFAAGIVLAIVTGIIVLSTRRSKASLRYNLLVSSLALFTGAVLAHFIQRLLEINPTTILANGSVGITDPATIYASDTGSGGDSAGILRFLHVHADTIVLLWSFIVVVKLFQLMTGLQSLSILKRKGITAVSQELQSYVNRVSKKLGINQMIAVAASGIAKVPMVIGHLKPMILLPLGLVTSLPAESIEAILVHELAHIRRRDWLINLLVVTLEILFFFNPAVLWIAALIRTERENCCDDIAITYAGSTTDYIDTLVACEEYQLASSKYGIAFTGRKKPLLARVKRMLSDKNSSLTQAERGIMGVSLLLAFIGLISFPGNTQTKKTPLLAPVVMEYIDTVPRDARTGYRTLLRSNSHLYDSLSLQNDSMAAAMARVDQQLALNDSIAFQLHTTAANERSVRNDRKQNEEVPQKSELNPNNDPGVVKPYRVISDSSEGKRLSNLDILTSSLNSQQGLRMDGLRNYKTGEPTYTSYPDPTNQPTNNTRSYEVPQSYQQAAARYAYPKEKAFDEETSMAGLVVALKSAGIIRTKDDVRSFKLSDTEFILNDNKMPDDIYLPLRNAFVPEMKGSHHWAWMYNFKT